MKSSGHYNSLGQYVEVSPVDDWWNEGGIGNLIPKLMARNKGWHKFNDRIENIVNKTYAKDPGMVDKNFFSFKDNPDLAQTLVRGYGAVSEVDPVINYAVHRTPVLMPLAYMNNYDKARTVLEDTGDKSLAYSKFVEDSTRTAITSAVARGAEKAVAGAIRKAPSVAAKRLPGRMGPAVSKTLSKINNALKIGKTPPAGTAKAPIKSRLAGITLPIAGYVAHDTHSKVNDRWMRDAIMKDVDIPDRNTGSPPDVADTVAKSTGSTKTTPTSSNRSKYIVVGTLALITAAIAAKRMRDRRKRRKAQEGYVYE